MAGNKDDNDFTVTVSDGGVSEYVGMLTGNTYKAENGNVTFTVGSNYGDILVPKTGEPKKVKPVTFEVKKEEPKKEEPKKAGAEKKESKKAETPKTEAKAEPKSKTN